MKKETFRFDNTTLPHPSACMSTGSSEKKQQTSLDVGWDHPTLRISVNGSTIAASRAKGKG